MPRSHAKQSHCQSHRASFFFSAFYYFLTFSSCARFPSSSTTFTGDDWHGAMKQSVLVHSRHFLIGSIRGAGDAVSTLLVARPDASGELLLRANIEETSPPFLHRSSIMLSHCWRRRCSFLEGSTNHPPSSERWLM